MVLYTLLKTIYKLYRRKDVSVLTSLKLNFKIFDFATAIICPIIASKRIETYHLYKGCIRFTSDIEFGMISIGIDYYPVFANQYKNVLMRFTNGGHLTVGRGIIIRPGCSIICTNGGKCSIGNNFRLNYGSLIFCTGTTKIGNNCSIGWFNQIYDSNLHHLYNVKDHTANTIQGQVIIGDNAWITNHCTITKGAILPKFSIVASGSLVNKDFSNIKYSESLMLVGRPAISRPVQYKRIFNRYFDSQIRQYFLNHPNINNIDLDDLDYIDQSCLFKE